MASTVIGQLPEFHPDSGELFSAYVERVHLFLEVNDIGEGKRVAVLLSAIGSKTYGLLRNLVAPAKPKDKSFSEIVAVLTKHCEPKPLVIAERFHFHCRQQATGESVSCYVAELRRLATNCEFGAYLEEALRDRFVCGLKNEGTQKWLLSEADLTFQKALEIAQGMEAAAKNAKELQSQTAPGVVPFEEVVHNITSRNCYRCGRANHMPAQCPFKEAKCHNCGKTGHIRRTCRSKPKRASRDPRQDWSRRQAGARGRSRFRRLV